MALGRPDDSTLDIALRSDTGRLNLVAASSKHAALPVTGNSKNVSKKDHENLMARML
jgi:hypothetical protein